MPPPPAPDRTPEGPLRGLAALERLRGQVESAVAEIERLREQNAALAERIGQLEEAVSGESPVLPLDGDPASLRDKVKGFIEAIDRALATGEPPEGLVSSPDLASSPDAAPPDPSADASPDDRDG